MDAATFLQTLDHSAPPPALPGALEALWWGHKQDWQRAHDRVAGESGEDAARVHAWLHRLEGDVDNARYWYRRAHREVPTLSLDEEWRALVDELTAQA